MTNIYDPDPEWDRMAWDEAAMDAEARKHETADVPYTWAICRTCEGNGCGECNGTGEIAVPEEEQ